MSEGKGGEEEREISALLCIYTYVYTYVHVYVHVHQAVLKQVPMHVTSSQFSFFCLFAGEILNVMHELPFGERSAKHILYHIFKQIVNYKKQDGSKGEVCKCVCGSNGGGTMI